MMDKTMTIKGLIEAVTVLEAYVPKRFWGASMDALHEAIDRIRDNGDRPRVLELHEAQGADYCFVESSNNPCVVRVCDVVMTSRKFHDKNCSDIRVIGECSYMAFDEEYNVTWRCWDKEPDWEEMKNTEWGSFTIQTEYPTWADFLYYDFIVWCQENYPHRAKDEKAWWDYLYETHIPTKIAEQLGLEKR